MMDNINSYTFPFDTCETPRQDSIVAQPYSVLVNLVSCAILSCFLILARRPSTKITLLAILLFESWHTWSHSNHLQGMIQLNVVHGLAYLINFSFLWLMYDLSKKRPLSPIAITSILFIILLDIYSFCCLPFLYYLSTQVLFLFLILMLYRHLIPTVYLSCLVILIVFLIGLIVNESAHCKRMMAYWSFPYHIFIEITGTLIFFCIGMMLLEMEKEKKKKKIVFF